MLDLVVIIQSECLPERNCMLTVQDVSGETGFLYFKEAQLIEANSGAEWGNTAFAEILRWDIESYSIGEIPLGIKRTLWEPIDKLIEDVRGAGAGEGVREVVRHLPAQDVEIEPEYSLDSESCEVAQFRNVIDQIRGLPGFLCAFHEVDNKIRPLTGNPPHDELTGNWILQFTEEIASVGQGLGAGHLIDWNADLEAYHIWQIYFGGDYMYIISDKQTMDEDFEAQCRAIIGGDV